MDWQEGGKKSQRSWVTKVTANPGHKIICSDLIPRLPFSKVYQGSSSDFRGRLEDPISIVMYLFKVYWESTQLA